MEDKQRLGTSSRVPTVSRVCADQTIVELAYDAEARTTGLIVSRFGGLWNIEQEVRIETGEILIPYSAQNNLIANECVLLPSKPVEFGSKDDLIADIRMFLHRYVDLSPVFEQIAAYYVLLTWVHDAFGELPYLRLRGDYGTGKTRALMAIGSLCYRPFLASAASTVSPIFHTIDSFGGTLILDESDLPFSDAKSELVKILNNGTVAGMPVLRTMQNRHKEFNPQAFRVFGPKIIAMRETFEDQALESRLITEEMGVRPLRSDVPIHLPAVYKAEALALRNRLLHFRLCHRFDIRTNATALIEGAAPRANQSAISLLSLIDEPALRKEVADVFMQQEAELRAERSDTAEGGVLAAALAAFAESSGSNVSVRDIADQFNAAHCIEYEGRMSNKWIGYVLRRRLRLATRKSNGVYVVPLSEKPKLNALAARYGLSG
jgi:hypothetical protein